MMTLISFIFPFREWTNVLILFRSQQKQWDMSYELLSSSNLGTKDKPELIYHVVPRSSDIIVMEGEFILIKVHH